MSTAPVARPQSTDHLLLEQRQRQRSFSRHDVVDRTQVELRPSAACARGSNIYASKAIEFLKFEVAKVYRTSNLHRIAACWHLVAVKIDSG